MITFEVGNKRFKYRVAGIAVHNDQVLLHQADGDNFWVFPGGHAELGESAEQTLKREFMEELNTEVDVIRLLWLVENFFTYSGRSYHELALYFLIQLAKSSPLLRTESPTIGWEGDVKFTFRWFCRDPLVLAQLPLLPSFLQTSLNVLPETPQYLVHYG
jgi:8-oxo-dGTP pyrophosphatase MutT (NUDIX family)